MVILQEIIFVNEMLVYLGPSPSFALFLLNFFLVIRVLELFLIFTVFVVCELFVIDQLVLILTVV